MSRNVPLLAVSCLLAAVVVTGCKPAGTNSPSRPATSDAVEEDDHGHPEHGPHNGELIALGGEAFHAEVLLDEDAKKVTIYLLDEHAEEADDAKAKEITFLIKIDGKQEQFTIAAADADADDAGLASKFESAGDEALLKGLDHDNHDNVEMRAEIAGKMYRGGFEEHHDHEHGHDHDDEDHGAGHKDKDHDHEDE